MAPMLVSPVEWQVKSSGARLVATFDADFEELEGVTVVT